MSNVQFTQSQRKAIELDGTNILVSAGAGSGKTAVLTERVIRKLRKGIRIDHLIILTFTNAAADEMKHRIKDKILQDEKLIYQLKYLDNAIISTFDSFSLRLVQTYYYLLGVPSNIQIADNVLLEKAKKDALEIILKENYQSPTNAFKTLIMSLFDKGDFTIQEGIKAFEKGLDMIPNPSDYLDQYESCFLSESFYEKTILEFESLLMEMNDELIIGYEHMIHLYDATHLISVVKYISELKNNYHIIEKIHSIDEFLSAFAILKHPSSPRFPDEEEELKQEFKKSHIMVKSTFEKIIKTVDNLFASNKESLMNSAKMIKDSILEIASLTKSYLNRKKIIMSESGLYSFSDIMNLSIKLLEENKDVREFYQNMINEIMIDEYQDTNDLQDYMISLLEKNNVFMVGDIKQSIYGFRNANPDNFYKKYIRYSNKNGGVAIDLAENFRSRKEVLEDINTIFEHIMDRDIGGIDYKQGQALIRGNLLYDRFQLHDYHTNIFQYDFDSVLEKFPEMNADTYEAKVVISDIMDKIKQGFQVVDLGGESTRNVEYRDFCILVDRKSHFDKYEDEFSQAGIPLLKIADEVFSNSIEILFIHQYLMLIKCSIDESYYNLYFKEAFYAVARSFVYQITDDVVVSYLLQKQLSMADNWQNLLRVKEFTSIASDIIYFGTHIGDLSLGNLVETIIDKLNLYERVLNLSNPNSSEKKLDFLVEKVQNLSYFNLDDLIEYFDSIYDDEHMDVEYAYSVDFSANKVKLMSMHKSKGLEFPYTYYIGLDNKFNYTENKSFFVFDKTYGLITKAFDNGFYDTYLKTLIERKNYQTYISERMRLFYVALTRTKEKMVLIINQNKVKDFPLHYNQSHVLSLVIRRNYHSQLDIISSIPEIIPWFQNKTVEFKPQLKVDALIQNQMYHFNKFNYQAKEVVSTHYSKPTFHMIDAETKIKMQKGIDIHHQFEIFDFKNIDISLSKLDSFIYSLFEKFFLRFPKTLFERADIYQEYEFYEETSLELKHGIIDLIIVYENEITVIDYKLKNIEDELYILQVDGYAKYLQKLLNKPIKAFLYSIISGETKEVVFHATNS